LDWPADDTDQPGRQPDHERLHLRRRSGVRRRQRAPRATGDHDGRARQGDAVRLLRQRRPGPGHRALRSVHAVHGRRHRAPDPDGNETSSGYDQFGNLTAVTDPNGNHYDYAYTARNSVAEVRLRNWHSDPADAPPTGTGDYLVLQAYSYDFAGRLASTTDAMG